jgi:2-amino-4-hydroxy-6-hydroxymethyldihydropteridine pyrophosphokinase
MSLLDKEEDLHNVFLGLGSNLGDRGENLNRAINNIEEGIGEVVSTSAFYVTNPEGFSSDNRFLNAVCEVKTSMKPFDVLKTTQMIEKEMGREAKSANGVYTDRIIDIDLLLFDDQVLEKDNLVLPHPHLHERSFVLIPLSEIAGDHIHPILRKTIDELKESLMK